MGSIAFYLQWCLDHLNYWTITLLMAIESSFIPFPSEVVVTPAAYKAAEGELNVVWVVVFATLGANIGALFNYYLAYFVGRPIIYRFAASRWGRLCLIDVDKVKRQRPSLTATVPYRLLSDVCCPPSASSSPSRQDWHA